VRPKEPPSNISPDAQTVWWTTIQNLRGIDLLHLVSPAELAAFCAAVAEMPTLQGLMACVNEASEAVAKTQAGAARGEQQAALKRMKDAHKAYDEASSRVYHVIINFSRKYGGTPASRARLGLMVWNGTKWVRTRRKRNNKSN